MPELVKQDRSNPTPQFWGEINLSTLPFPCRNIDPVRMEWTKRARFSLCRTGRAWLHIGALSLFNWKIETYGWKNRLLTEDI